MVERYSGRRFPTVLLSTTEFVSRFKRDISEAAHVARPNNQMEQVRQAMNYEIADETLSSIVNKSVCFISRYKRKIQYNPV